MDFISLFFCVNLKKIMGYFWLPIFLLLYFQRKIKIATCLVGEKIKK